MASIAVSSAGIEGRGKYIHPKIYVGYMYLSQHLIPASFNGVIMSAMVSQITGVCTVCSTSGSGANQRKIKNSSSLAFQSHRANYDVTVMNIMFAYELTIPIARTSAAMMLTLIAHNISFIMNWYHMFWLVLIGWVFLINIIGEQF